MKKIELLNSEGPILIAEWADRTRKFNTDLIMVTLCRTDECYLFTKNEFVDYLSGDFVVEDCILGKYSHFKREDYTGMLPSYENLMAFINYR